VAAREVPSMVYLLLAVIFFLLGFFCGKINTVLSLIREGHSGGTARNPANYIYER